MHIKKLHLSAIYVHCSAHLLNLIKNVEFIISLIVLTKGFKFGLSTAIETASKN